MAQIFVKVNGSKATPMEVNLTDDKVEDVMRQIQEDKDVYVTMHGKVLRRNEKLKSCGVSDGCTIQVMSKGCFFLQVFCFCKGFSMFSRSFVFVCKGFCFCFCFCFCEGFRFFFFYLGEEREGVMQGVFTKKSFCSFLEASLVCKRFCFRFCFCEGFFF